jgi:hypothetical protein
MLCHFRSGSDRALDTEFVMEYFSTVIVLGMFHKPQHAMVQCIHLITAFLGAKCRTLVTLLSIYYIIVCKIPHPP